jgi:DNA-binding MarR family transcriptional regulator
MSSGNNRGTFVGYRGVKNDMLSSWMEALVAYVRSGQPDLTNRQMALLLLVYRTNGPHTVRGLAAVLGVSKPVVTRALNTLGRLGYLRRERDERDRRNIFVTRTSRGADFLEGFRGLIAGKERRRPQAVPQIAHA